MTGVSCGTAAPSLPLSIRHSSVSCGCSHWKRQERGLGRWFSRAKLTLSKAAQAAWLHCGRGVCQVSTFLSAAPTRVSWGQCALAEDIASPCGHGGYWKALKVPGELPWAEAGRQPLTAFRVHLAGMQTATMQTATIAMTASGRQETLNGQMKLKAARFRG